jgi:gamma-glutamyltranspeptidase/glutathione hydrolase
VIEAETGTFDAATVQGLQAMGHALKLPGDSAEGGRGSSHVWGNLQTVEWDKRSNTLSGGSDPRNEVGSAEVLQLAAPAR